MTAEERSASARQAALARWSGKPKAGLVGAALELLAAWLAKHPGSVFAERGLEALKSHYASVGE